MFRLSFLVFLVTAWALPAQEKFPFNVLILFADDQRPDTIAALGNKYIQTPNLDRLVRQGVSFERAYMQGGLQPATCVPSRAMLMAGQSLFRVDTKLTRDPTWPAAFAKLGYTTFLSGKWHNGIDSVKLSFSQSRSVYPGGMVNPLQAKLVQIREKPPHLTETFNKHTCEVFADEAIAFLNRHQKGSFFCYIPFNAPHDPHTVPPDFPIRYDPAKIPLPANYLPQHPWDNGEMTIRDEKLLPWPRTPEQIRSMLADYYRYISFLDAQIGRILSALEASPHADKTIVVFSADSGVSRGSHGLIGKQNLYEHSVRVPLIIAGPGIPKDRRTSAMCYLFDLLPTLGELCGIGGLKSSDGISFAAVLRDPSQAARNRLMFAYRDVQRAVRDDRWKLIRYPEIHKSQLFDLQSDPHEVTNLAERPEQTERVAQMLQWLQAEQKTFGDTLPLSAAKPKPAEWTPPK